MFNLILAYGQSDWSPAYSVGDPDFGNSQVGSKVHHPPVAVIRGRPETRLLCQQTVYCFTRVVLCMGAAGCCWERRGRGLNFCKRNHAAVYDDLTWPSSGEVFTITKVLVDNVHTNSLHHPLCACVCVCTCACVQVCMCVHVCMCVCVCVHVCDVYGRGREEEGKIL